MLASEEEIKLLLFDRHVRTTILEILRITARARSSFSDIISQELRRKKNLSSKRRRAISNTAYMMIRMKKLIDFLLQNAEEERSDDEKITAQEDINLARFALALLTFDGVTAEQVSTGDFPDWLPPLLARVHSVELACSGIKDENEKLATQSSMPTWFANRVIEDRGYDEAEKLLKAMNSRAPLTLRANTLKANPESLIQKLAQEEILGKPCQLSPWGVRLEGHRNIRALYSYRKGLMEAQDEGSQLIAMLVAPPENGKVLDLCAGAGGKTLALAAMMQNRGELIATDIDPRRLSRLKPRLQRSGATNVSLHPWGKKLPKGWKGRVDRILIDAPCSGSGTLRRNPGMRWQLSEDTIERLSGTQAEIIQDALPLVRPGGWIIYATCSVLAQENEAVVEQALAANPGLETIPITEVVGEELGSAIGSGPYMRMGPHSHDTDGFFAAVLRVKA